MLTFFWRIGIHDLRDAEAIDTAVRAICAEAGELCLVLRIHDDGDHLLHEEAKVDPEHVAGS